jgi:PAS domain S-box-containing protein
MSKPQEPKQKQVHGNGRSREVAAFMEAARGVLENRALAETTGVALRSCRSLLGAEVGVLAVRKAGGEEFEVVRVEPDDCELDANGGLPAPLRRLLGRVANGQAAFDNDHVKRAAKAPAKTPATAHPAPAATALLAPIFIADKLAGVLGLLAKPAGFSARDGQLAEVFAEICAVAMLNRETVNGLEKDRSALERDLHLATEGQKQVEKTFRTLVENLPDAISRFDSELRHLYVSPVVERITGRPAQEFQGRTSTELGIMSADLIERFDDHLRRVFATGNSETLEFTFAGLDGPRHFENRFVSESPAGEAVASVLAVGRDVTERVLALEAERRARQVAEDLREATLALARSFDRETVLTTLLDRLRPIVPFDHASVMLIDESTRVSVRAVFDGDRVVALPPEERSQFDVKDHPIVSDILSKGKPVLIPDVREYPGWSLPTDRDAEVSWMGVPLFARGEIAGLFALSKREPAYFNDEHARMAEAMSSQVSVAVENAVLFEQMQASASRMRALSRRLVDVQESERRSIARELHDEAGQALASLRYGLRLLEREIDAGGDVTARVAELMQRTDGVIEGLQRLAADLRPVSLDHLGLESALRQYAKDAAVRFGLVVHFRAKGFDGKRLPATVETALYRIVQEAMTNIVRHAKATQVDVLAERRDGRVLVMVEDNGAGFDPERVARGEHFGLLGMKERVEALDGSLTIESSSGGGTTVVAEVSSVDSHPDR